MFVTGEEVDHHDHHHRSDHANSSHDENHATEIGSWLIRMSPVKKRMYQGHMIPTMKGLTSFFNKKPRRVVVEIHYPQNDKKRLFGKRPQHNVTSLQALGDQDRIVVRVLKKSDDNDDDSVLVDQMELPDYQDEDGSLSKDGDHAMNWDKHSEASHSPSRRRHHHYDEDTKWIERSRFVLGNMEIKKIHNTKRHHYVEIKAGSGPDAFERDIAFETNQDVNDFVQTFETLMRLEQERGDRQLKAYRHKEEEKLKKSNSPTFLSRFIPLGTADATPNINNVDATVSILIEVVSARNLPAADFSTTERARVVADKISAIGSTIRKSTIMSSKTKSEAPSLSKAIQEDPQDEPMGSSDPYVIIRLGNREIHRTQVIYDNLDPIWTLHSGSLCLLQCSAEEFFTEMGRHDGLTFVVKDYDRMDRDDTLGSVSVPTATVLACDGKRLGYPVIPLKPQKTKPQKEPTLYLRMRRASENDIRFMEHYEAIRKKTKQGVHNEETYLPPRNIVEPHLKKNKTVKHVHEDETKKGKTTTRERLHRVKPCPDPKRVEETEWMNDEQVEAETWKQSTQWIEAGSGDLGKLYVEILGCSHLPNLDLATLSLTDKTDAFCCLAYEDVVVNTDVISNTLSPRWMPWSRRAFVFNMTHPASKLFLGLFDYDSSYSPLQEAKRVTTSKLHDRIGRVMINLSRFVPNTVYTLTYPIYRGELAQHRLKNRGTVTLRLRFSFKNTQQALAKTIMTPPTEYVSLSRGPDFQLASYCCSGKHDFNAWSMQTFTRHIEELQSYDVVLDYVIDALMTVWLWRGHHAVTMCGKTVLIPAHSITAYIWALLICYNFNAFFSFVCFAIGWAMLAINYQVRLNPSPWHKCASYGTLWSYLIFGKAFTDKHPAHYKEAEFEDYMDEYKKKVADKAYEQKLEMQFDEEIIRELGDSAIQGNEEVDIATHRQGGLVSKMNVLRGMNPIRLILHPIQIELGKVVILTRKVKSVVMWKESYYAFWITTASMIAALAVLWLPWGWILRWLLRLILIIGLGPWMRIVDRKFFAEKPDLTPEQKKEVIRERVKKRYGAAVEAAEHAQIEKERQLKLQAMKSFLYGKHIVRVPHFNEEYFSDLPLPESHSEFYTPKKHGSPVIAQRIHGQRLSGDMIPKREVHFAEETEKKNSAKQRHGSVFQTVKAASNMKQHASALKKASMQPTSKSWRATNGYQTSLESTPLLEATSESPMSGQNGTFV